MAVIRDDVKVVKLLSRDSVSPYSDWFVLNEQHTIVAAGLRSGMEIHFEMAVVKGGKLGEINGCSVSAPKPSEIERIQKLTCPECVECKTQYLRLTKHNQFIILDAPQGVPIRVVYVITTLGSKPAEMQHSPSVDVLAYVNTKSVPQTDAQRGCPPPLPVQATLKIPKRGYIYDADDQFIDHDAEVRVEDCFGNTLGFMFADWQYHARLEVQDFNGELLGYAIDGKHGDTELECS